MTVTKSALTSGTQINIRIVQQICFGNITRYRPINLKEQNTLCRQSCNRIQAKSTMNILRTAQIHQKFRIIFCLL
jgi:hypothetical protein